MDFSDWQTLVAKHNNYKWNGIKIHVWAKHMSYTEDRNHLKQTEKLTPKSFKRKKNCRIYKNIKNYVAPKRKKARKQPVLLLMASSNFSLVFGLASIKRVQYGSANKSSNGSWSRIRQRFEIKPHLCFVLSENLDFFFLSKCPWI